MGNKVNHIESADFVFAQQVGRLRLLLAEDGDQTFAPVTSLRPEDWTEYRALQHTLEAERRLCVALLHWLAAPVSFVR